MTQDEIEQAAAGRTDILVRFATHRLKAGGEAGEVLYEGSSLEQARAAAKAIKGTSAFPKGRVLVQFFLPNGDRLARSVGEAILGGGS